MPQGARPSGGEADALAEGLITSGHPELPDAREEIGCGTEHGGIGEAEPGSHNRVIFEGRETARAAVLPRGLQGVQLWSCARVTSEVSPPSCEN